MKKLLSLITTTILLVVSVACMTGCSMKPSQEEINATRENAINYASKAYQAVSEQEWFDDYTLVGVYCDGADYEHFKEPVEESPSQMIYVDLSTNKEEEIETIAVTERNFYFAFYFVDQNNEYYRCDASFMGASKMTSVETGEVVSDVSSMTTVHEISKADQNYFDNSLGEARENGYKVDNDNNCSFFIKADEIKK